MDRKLVLSELAEGLAQRVKMPQKEAEVFVRQFFDEISDNLFLENIVKIKAFGTFKLMDVDARESIDIHSGNRIQIAEHTKVSFVPDAVLRDAVNKPFLEFETVILNEGTDLEAMAALELPSEMIKTEETEAEKQETETPVVEMPVVAEESVAEEPVTEEPLETEEPVTVEPTVAEPVKEDPIIEELVAEEQEAEKSQTEELPVEKQPSEVNAQTEEIVDLPDNDSSQTTVVKKARVVEEADVVRHANYVQEQDNHKSSHCLGHVFGGVLAALLFFIVGYVVGYLRPVSLPFLEKQSPSKETVKTQNAKKPQTKQQPKVSKPKTKPATSDTTRTVRPIKPQPSEALAYPQVEDGEYLIVGIKDTVVMKAGKTLLNISIQYYRSQDFVPYICKMNGITNPDIVPLDKELKIPELKHK